MLGVDIITIGLIFDIAGVVMLFRYGPPPPVVLPGGNELLWTHATNDQARKAKWQYRLSKTALVLLGIGFLLQAIGNYYGNSTH
jgi:hypothetical protein